MSLVTCTFLPADSMLAKDIVYGTSLLPLENIAFAAYVFDFGWFWSDLLLLWGFCLFLYLLFSWSMVCWGFWWVFFWFCFFQKSYIYSLCQLQPPIFLAQSIIMFSELIFNRNQSCMADNFITSENIIHFMLCSSFF